jgi:hypothetical protein
MNRIIPRDVNPRELIQYGKKFEADTGNFGLLGSKNIDGESSAAAILAPEFETMIQGSEPESLNTYKQIRDVISDVETRSKEIDGLDGVEGKDALPGLGVRSPEDSPTEYSFERDMLNWSGPDREAFHFHQPGSSSAGFEQLEFKRVESDNRNYEIYASQKGDASAPASMVIFDARESSYTLLSGADLKRAVDDNSGFL